VASNPTFTSNGITVSLRPGDPVKKVSDGTVILAAAGDALFGVVCDVLPFFDGTKMVRAAALPSATTYGSNLERQSKVAIYLMEGNLFECICDDATTATTQAAYTAFIGENLDLSMNGVSGDLNAYPKLDISSHATADGQLRIVNLSYRPNIDYSGANVPLIVTGNEVQQAPDVTVGV
jgi:hypothetical protein